MKKLILLLSFYLCFAGYTQAQIITTIAGCDTEGYFGDGGPALAAFLNEPIGVAVDGSGNVYIGDRNNNRVRKVNAAGVITTLAGTGTGGYSGDDSLAANAMINYPYGVAVDAAGNVYIADCFNERIRKVDTAGIITTVAGNGTLGYNGDNIPATDAELHTPIGVTVDGNGNLYIADAYNYRIRKVNTSGIITTIGGSSATIDSGDNGPATAAGINQPYCVALDAAGNIYIGEQGGYLVRKISTSGIITAIAGTGTPGYSGDNGPATAAKITRIFGIAVDPVGQTYISDADNARIRKIDAAGTITTYAGEGEPGFGGDGGPALAAYLSQPTNITMNEAGNMYIADFGNSRIRYLTSTLAVSNLQKVGDALTLYPNPNNGAFTLRLLQAINEEAHVTITNMAGEKVKEFATTTNTTLNIQLNIPSGIYFLTAITAQGRWTTRLMIEQ